jgi:hypothetical protein
MRVVTKFLLFVLATGMALAQANPPSTSVNDELKSLREALAEQQKAMALQQQQMEQQKQQMAVQQLRIEDLQKTLNAKTSGAPRLENASLSNVPASNTPEVQSDADKAKESPLSFRIGGTEFTPGGFVDFENVFRSTNATGVLPTGNPIATSFGSIPFSNAVQGHLTEFKTTGQYSRYNLKVSGKYGANNVVGYIEGDFNGNDATNVFVTANGHTNRLRLYWLDLKRGNWEFLGGSTWGLETPNRVGLSPMPADLALGIGEDANVHVGIPYTRASEFRAVYHFNDNFQWGFAVQNPDQFVGSGEVIFPFAFNAQLGGQFDAANQNGTPNAFPDFHTKAAWDTDINGRHLHWEVGGLTTSAKITDLEPSNTPAAAFHSHAKIGGAVHSALSFEVLKGFRVLANGMWGNGPGRYMIGLGPQAVVIPVNSGGNVCTPASGCGAELSLVHAGALFVGSEIQAGKKSQLGFYYGGNYFQRSSFADISNPANPTQPCLDTTILKPCAGFGGGNSPGSANRAIQEGSIDWTQTFWKNPQYGAVLLVTQASYLTRAPWFVPAGAPKNAHLTMGFVSLRYVLP